MLTQTPPLDICSIQRVASELREALQMLVTGNGARLGVSNGPADGGLATRIVQGRSTTWYAIAVRPRLETVAARCLSNGGHDVFLPLAKVRPLGNGTSSSSPGRLTDVPVFPGYLLARFDRGDPSEALLIPGVRFVVVAAEHAR